MCLYAQEPTVQTGNSRKDGFFQLPARWVLSEHVEGRLLVGYGVVDEAQATPFALGVRVPVLGEQLVTRLYAFEAAVWELRECRPAQQVGPFLLHLRLHHCHHRPPPLIEGQQARAQE